MNRKESNIEVFKSNESLDSINFFKNKAIKTKHIRIRIVSKTETVNMVISSKKKLKIAPGRILEANPILKSTA